MTKSTKAVRQSAGSQAKAAEKEQFFALAARLSETSNSAEKLRTEKKLAQMTFGD
jgi:hypothetical protein